MASRLSLILLAAGSAAAGQDDQAVFQRVCGACHSHTLISDLKSGPEWEETVDNMISQGAKAGASERAAILRHLTRNFTRININSASAAEISQVLDVSESTAQKLIEHRPYRSMDELLKSAGVSAAQIKGRLNRIAFR